HAAAGLGLARDAAARSRASRRLHRHARIVGVLEASSRIRSERRQETRSRARTPSDPIQAGVDSVEHSAGPGQRLLGLGQPGTEASVQMGTFAKPSVCAQALLVAALAATGCGTDAAKPAPTGAELPPVDTTGNAADGNPPASGDSTETTNASTDPNGDPLPS